MYCLLIGVVEVVPAQLGAGVFLISLVGDLRGLDRQGWHGCGIGRCSKWVPKTGELGCDIMVVASDLRKEAGVPCGL